MEKGPTDMRRYAVTWAAVLLICFHLASGQVRNQAPRFTGQLAIRVVKTAPVGTTTLTTLNAVDNDGPSPVNIYISDFATRQLVQLKTVPGLSSSRRVMLSSSLAAEPPSTKSLYIVASDGRARTTATITLQVINPVSPILTGLNTTGLISNPPDVQTVASNLQLLANTICDLYTNQSQVSGSISRLRLFCLLFKAVYSQLPSSIFNSSEIPVPSINKYPVFTGPTSFTVRWNMAAGSRIGQLSAIDEDGPREIFFNLRDLRNTGRFDLGFTSGQSSSGRVVGLFLRQSLDSEPASREVLLVTASDGLATSTATVFVNVLSSDNNPPTFVQRNWIFVVRTPSIPGLKIGSVLALDRDSGNNGRVSYSFRAVNSSMETFFSLNNIDGSLYLKRPLQGTRNVTLIVTAVDGGGLKATANVSVLVRASNGNTSNSCGNSTCLNGGRCVQVSSRNYMCVCSPGYTGVNCTYRNSTSGCFSSPCQNGGTCYRGVSNSYRCHCPSGYTGFNCATRNTSNSCGNSTCQNGGRCVQVSSRNYMCVCSPGFTGVNCTYRNSTSGCFSSPCQNGGVCYRGVSNSYRCLCPSGYTGFNCATRNTSNSCGNSTCQNGGRCVQVSSRNYMCVCSPGYTGVNCTYRNSTSGCFSSPCQNGGVCYRGVSNSYRCLCPSGYTGFNCATRNTSNSCGNSTCQNGGRCVQVSSRNYMCVCSPGFTGVNCTYRNSTSGCFSSPCQNGGVCYRGVSNSYRCLCPSGYTGFNCAMRNTSNSCGNSTCQNGGRCVQVSSRNYMCVCSPGYTGVNCTYRNSTSGCFSSPCQNGGTCYRGVSNSYRCLCPSGYTGFNCATTGGPSTVNSTTVRIREDTAIGTQLLRINLRSVTGSTSVSSTDRTGTISLRLSLVGSSGTLIVTLGRSLDRERTARMEFTIYATDALYQISRKLILIITDVNDNPPVFTSPWSIAVSKATPVGTRIMTVNATDLDAGQNGNVSYSINGGTTGSNRFYLNRTSGVLSINGSLATIPADTVTLNVQAADNGIPMLISTTTISIRLTNSGPPVNSSLRFQPSVYSTSVMESIQRGSFLAQVALVDVNQRLVGREVSIRDPSYTVYADDFFINNNVTYISLRLNRTLDREVSSSKTVILIAATKTSPVISATCTVAIQVVDINDNSPVFQSSRYTATIASGAPVGSMVAVVSARDADIGRAGQVSYMFQQDSPEFTINANTGMITTLGTLSLSANTVRTMLVLAQDNGTPPLTSSAVMEIQITGQPDDGSNTGPVFDRSQVFVTVTENQPANTIITSLSARDPNGAISFVMEEDGNSFFALQQPSDINGGSSIPIITTRPLDREVIPSYRLLVVASDGRLQATATVTVQVQDVNDNAPVFMQRVYSASVPASYQVGSTILQITATDVDIGNNGQVTYRKQANTAQDLSRVFQVERSSGRIIQVAPLTNLTGRTVNFTVIATDNGTPSLSSSANVTIRVASDDGSNTGPVFDRSQVFVTVTENQPANTTITSLSARDPNGAISFVMEEDGNSFFALQQPIVTDGGISIPIITTRPLDREIIPGYLLLVVARDGRLQATATVTVQVQDVNDNAPFFTQRLYNSSVPASYQVGSTILQTRATDVDVGNNGQVTYRKQTNTTPDLSGVFQVERSSGRIIQVAPIANLAGRTVNFSVIAMDNGTPSLSSTAMVTIRVLGDDENQSPVLRGVPSTISIPENTQTGRLLFVVGVLDSDGPNRLALSLPDRESFDTVKIEGTAGNETILLARITLNTFLNREVDQTKVFRIVAFDGLNSVTSTVTIVIEDVNDNPPTFTSSSYSSTVSKSVNFGSPVLTVSATDPDQQNNGTVQYSVQSSTAPGYFSVDRNTGVISVVNSLTSLSDGQMVTLRVEARDIGVPLSLNASVLVRIVIQSSPVTAASNVAPSFTQQHVSFTVRENNPNGTYIGMIRASDSDGPRDLTMRVEGDRASNGASLVRVITRRQEVNNYSFFLLINTVFDRERDRVNNTVLLIASDGAAETTATVTIIVEDLNDNSPVFAQTTYTATVPETLPVNSLVIQVPASDADSGVFSEITYTMTSNNPVGNQVFRIDGRTGTIVTTRSLLGLSENLVLTVTATDGGRRSSTADVNIRIL